LSFFGFSLIRRYKDYAPGDRALLGFVIFIEVPVNHMNDIDATNDPSIQLRENYCCRQITEFPAEWMPMKIKYGL